MARVPKRQRREANQVGVLRTGVDTSIQDSLRSGAKVLNEAVSQIGRIKDEDERRKRNFELFQADDKDKAEYAKVGDEIEKMTDDELNGVTVDQLVEEKFGKYEASRNEIAAGIADSEARDAFAGRFPREQRKEIIRQAIQKRNDISISTQTFATMDRTVQEADSIEAAFGVADDLEYIGETGLKDSVIGLDTEQAVISEVEPRIRMAYQRGLRADMLRNPAATLAKLNDPETRAKLEQHLGADEVAGYHKTMVQDVVTLERATHERKLRGIASITAETDGGFFAAAQQRMTARVEDVNVRVGSLRNTRRLASSPVERAMIDNAISDVAIRTLEANQQDEDIIRDARVIDSVRADPDMNFIPGNEDDERLSNLAFQHVTLPRLQQLEQQGYSADERAEFLVRESVSMGAFPKEGAHYIKQKMASGNPDDLDFALAVYDKTRDKSPQVFDQFGDDITKDLELWRTLKNTRENADAVSTFEQVRTGKLTGVNARDRQAEYDRFDTVIAADERFSTENVEATLLDDLSEWTRIDADNIPQRYVDGFMANFKAEFAAVNDPALTDSERVDIAYRNALSHFSKSTQHYRIGSRRFWMNNSPLREAGLPSKSPEENMRWINQNLGAQVKELAADPDSVDPDKLLIFEWPDKDPQGKRVWAVFRENDAGQIVPVPAKGSSLPVLWNTSWDESNEYRTLQAKESLYLQGDGGPVAEKAIDQAADQIIDAEGESLQSRESRKRAIKSDLRREVIRRKKEEERRRLQERLSSKEHQAGVEERRKNDPIFNAVETILDISKDLGSEFKIFLPRDSQQAEGE